MKNLVNEGKLLVDGKPFTTVNFRITQRDDPKTFIIEKGQITFNDPHQAELFTQLQPCHTELVIESYGIVPIQLLNTPSRSRRTVQIKNCPSGKDKLFRFHAW